VGPAWLAQLQLDPNRGPQPTGDFEVEPAYFLAMVLIGFLVGTFGHIIKSKPMVAVGITLIFLATVLLPLGLAITN